MGERTACSNTSTNGTLFPEQAGCTNDSIGADVALASKILQPSLFDTHLTLSMVYMSFMGFALIVGLLGNVLILVSSCYAGIINKVGKEFVINLALADLCVTGIADPLCIVGVMKGERFFDTVPEFCELVAAMCLTACFCAFMSLLMLTVNRFIYLCHNEWYDTLYGKKTTMVLCFLCWVVAAICEFPNYIGWGGHGFDNKNHQCIWNRTANMSYSLFVSLGLIGGPLIIMGSFYVLIFMRIWNTKKSVYKLDYEDPYRMQKAWKETVKSSRLLFVLFTVFVVCWTPYAIIIIIDMDDKLPMEVHLFATMLAHMHSSANCIVYIICSQRFRRKALKVIGCDCEGLSRHSKSKMTDTTDMVMSVSTLSKQSSNESK